MLLYIFCIGFAVLTPPLFAGSGNLLGWQKGNTDARLLDGCVCMVHIFNLFGLPYIQKILLLHISVEVVAEPITKICKSSTSKTR